ncbi:MAG TPA: HAD family hydrolase [Planctomycetota bacterium]|nr:HAD family hydrolase [Planctomycetota bacterium]
MTLRVVTVDFWGTLLFDGPAADDRYRRRRVEDFARILAGAGVKVTAPALDRGYDASGAFLAEVWRRHRDVPVTDHVRALLEGADRGLPGRLPPDVLAALVDAYARPALIVPPVLDTGAPGALAALRAQGLTLAVVSNTMRTSGSTLRRLLEQHGILGCFAHTTFSDEVGVRKPDPGIFHLTLRALGCDAASAVHSRRKQPHFAPALWSKGAASR